MSPAVRLVTLLVVAAMAGMGQPTLLAFSALVTAVSFLVVGRSVIAAAFQALYRLRWLLISIVVVYLWFTPGVPLISAWGDRSPTLEGLETGLLRAGVLCVIALAAALTVNSTPRAGLAAGLVWLLQPLAWLGVPTRVFALRLSLTLDGVLAARKLPESRTPPESAGFIRGAAAVGAELFLAAERRGVEPERTKRVDLPETGAPPVAQWLIPGLLIVTAAIIVGL